MSIETNRHFMKSEFAESVHKLSDQAKKVPYPALQKPLPEGEVVLIDLPDPDPGILARPEFDRLIHERQSWRKYTPEGLSLEELSYLLFSTQGLLAEVGEGYASRRPVPSAGARHPFETYLAVNRVEGLEAGIYRYLPFSQQLLFLEASDKLSRFVNRGQPGTEICWQRSGVFRLELHPLPGRVALHGTCPQEYAPGRRPYLPEPVPGCHGPGVGDLCGRGLRPGRHGRHL